MPVSESEAAPLEAMNAYHQGSAELGEFLVVEVVEQLAGYQYGAEAVPGTLKRGS